MYQTIINVLLLLASLALLFAVYCCFKLSKESGHERYWLMLSIGLFIFAVHHWVMVPWGTSILPVSLHILLEPLSAIIGAAFVSYAAYGLYSSMRAVKSRSR